MLQFGNNLKNYSTLKISNEDFLNWFVGLSDGESSFYFTRTIINNLYIKYSFIFKLTMHIDDRKVLEYLHQNLNIGRLVIDGDEISFIVSKKEEIIILINIFSKYNLNTTKHLNFRDWKKAFYIYINRKLDNTSFDSELLKIKDQMNNNRTNFSMPENHKIKISQYWLLGFVEAEGSFLLNKTSLIPAFAIALNDKDAPVLHEIKNFFYNNLGFDLKSKFKLDNSSNLGIHFQTARGTTKGAVRFLIKNTHILYNYLIPFFNKMTFISKKGLDFSDFKLICFSIGGHENENIKNLILKLSNTMNNNRLSNSKKTKSTLLEKDELNILKNFSPIYNHLPDGTTINILNNKIANYRNFIYILTSSNGEVSYFINVDEVANFLNTNKSTLNRKLKLHPEGININNFHIQKLRVFDGI